MTPRYTFKDLRKNKRLTNEKLAELTGVFPQTLEELEIDSSNIDTLTLKILTRFYCLSVNYIFIGKQSEFEARQLDEPIKHTPLSRRLSALEVVQLEKKLGLNEFSLYQVILELSKEGDNEFTI